MNYEFISLIVAILVPVISGLFILSKQIKGVKKELKTEIKDIRDELKAEIKDVRGELKTEIKDVRGELHAVRDELKADIKQVEDKLSGDIKQVEDKLSGDIKQVEDKLSGDIKRVEDKLDGKERTLRQDFRSDIEKVSAEVIEQKMEIQRISHRKKERTKETQTLQDRFDHLVAALKDAMPQLQI